MMRQGLRKPIKLWSLVLLCIWAAFMASYTSARSIVGYADLHSTDDMRFVTADAIKMGPDNTEGYLDTVFCPSSILP